jgi:hypothetical protein
MERAAVRRIKEGKNRCKLRTGTRSIFAARPALAADMLRVRLNRTVVVEKGAMYEDP